MRARSKKLDREKERLPGVERSRRSYRPRARCAGHPDQFMLLPRTDEGVRRPIRVPRPHAAAPLRPYNGGELRWAVAKRSYSDEEKASALAAPAANGGPPNEETKETDSPA